MNLLLAVARALGLSRSRRQAWRSPDLGDMGTAFGLDAITTLDAESPEGAAARAEMASADRFQMRLHRRSSF